MNLELGTTEEQRERWRRGDNPRGGMNQAYAEVFADLKLTLAGIERLEADVIALTARADRVWAINVDLEQRYQRLLGPAQALVTNHRRREHRRRDPLCLICTLAEFLREG